MKQHFPYTFKINWDFLQKLLPDQVHAFIELYRGIQLHEILRVFVLHYEIETIYVVQI